MSPCAESFLPCPSNINHPLPVPFFAAALGIAPAAADSTLRRPVTQTCTDWVDLFFFFLATVASLCCMPICQGTGMEAVLCMRAIDTPSRLPICAAPARPPYIGREGATCHVVTRDAQSRAILLWSDSCPRSHMVPAKGLPLAQQQRCAPAVCHGAGRTGGGEARPRGASVMLHAIHRTSRSTRPSM